MRAVVDFLADIGGVIGAQDGRSPLIVVGIVDFPEDSVIGAIRRKGSGGPVNVNRNLPHLHGPIGQPPVTPGELA